MPRDNSPSLLRRMAAMLYDTFLVLPVIMLLVALAIGVQTLIGGQDAEPIKPVFTQLLAALGVIGFYIGFWQLKGQTLGMQAWRIQLSTFDGSTATASQCLIRCLAALISLLPLGLGFWWCMFDRHGRYWHDYLSHTELRLLPKVDKSKTQ